MTRKVVSLSERRKHPRVSDAVALRFDCNKITSPLDPHPTHIVKMSCGGIHFVHDAAIDADTRLFLSMYLPSSDQTIHITGRVVSSGEEKNPAKLNLTKKQYFVQLEFTDLNSDDRQLLKNHVEYVIQKTGVSHRDVHHLA